MKKADFPLLVIATVFVVFASACGALAAPRVFPALTKPPLPTVSVEIASKQVALSKPPNQAFAPVCKNSAASCVAPDVQNVDALSTYCVEKIPYTNILVDPGTTFEVLDKSGKYSCANSGQKIDGKTVITCTGKELFSFNLKLTNPACSGRNLITGTGQCQEGFGFDAAQGCCSPITGNKAGSVTIKVNLGACPLPQEQ